MDFGFPFAKVGFTVMLFGRGGSFGSNGKSCGGLFLCLFDFFSGIVSY